jgi:hypothetical protein
LAGIKAAISSSRSIEHRGQQADPAGLPFGPVTAKLCKMAANLRHVLPIIIVHIERREFEYSGTLPYIYSGWEVGLRDPLILYCSSLGSRLP